MKCALPVPALLATLMLLLPLSGRADDAPSALVSVTRIVQQPLHDRLTVYGRVASDPAHVHSLTSLHSGIVERTMVTPGQQVTKGQPLLALASSPQAQMAYAQARSKLTSAQAQLKQSEALYRESLVTHADLAAARQNLNDAKAGLAAIEAQGTGHATQLLRASEAGTISRVDVSPGALVQPGQPLLTLSAQTHLWIRLGVEPEEAAKVHTGAPVDLRAVFGSSVVHAKVAQVNNVIDPATHLVDAVVELDGKDTAGLVPGSWMRGVIRLGTQAGLAVPRSAVLSEHGQSYVFIIQHGHATRVNVHTGLESAGLVAIAGAVHEGDMVVTSGNYELTDGMAVRLAKEPMQ
ncbi:efflux RND transporter periplasmic adaptor subunit [Dyella sp. A6]|uniref:efflux RND transporter periplasmic adaptor subunit n=1 Tax=Dyella aluminiiresistens TaxID=3069105 RepID=UPI002E79EBEE|nr:efflux RND transporter periplasmic adaptor subunit [Dyella sp. A6]